MFKIIDGKTFITVSARDVRPGDINVDGAKCISCRPRLVQSASGQEYVDIVWDDAPLLTHVTHADRSIIIEG